MPYPLHSLKISFLGCGHIAQSIISGYLKYSEIPEKNIFISGRNLKKTKRISSQLKVNMVSDNEELLEKSSVIFICVKPQDMEEAIQSLKALWEPNHTVFSLAAGVSFNNLKKWGLNCSRLIRLMPNTSVCIGKGFLPFCSLKHSESLNSFAESLLKPLGQVLALKEESLLTPITVASASGLAFILELMQYWLEWLTGEGLPYEQARTLIIQNFLGASEMSKRRNKKGFLELQKEIVSPGGVTQEGLIFMRELELERLLRLSFEKARLKIKELERIKETYDNAKQKSF